MPQSESTQEVAARGSGEMRPDTVVTGQPVLKAKDLDAFLRQSAEDDQDPDGAAYLRIIDQVLAATSPDSS